MDEGWVDKKVVRGKPIGMWRCNYGDSESAGLSPRTTFIFIGT